MTETYDKENHWYGWNGGECPVHPETYVYLMYRGGNSDRDFAKNEDWRCDKDNPHCRDIIAFRIVKLYREPRKAREWWVNIYPDGPGTVWHDSKAEADAVRGGGRTECIHVREVLEPSDDN